MNDKNNILNELEELGSPLAGMPRHMPYSVPDGYFNVAPVIAKSGIMADKVGVPFDVPANYFDTLPEKALATAKAADKKNKTIAFAPKLQWLQAAALALIITAGGYITLTNHHKQPEQVLASISKADIKAYMEYAENESEPTGTEAVKALNIDNKEIVAYLNETGWE